MVPGAILSVEPQVRRRLWFNTVENTWKHRVARQHPQIQTAKSNSFSCLSASELLGGISENYEGGSWVRQRQRRGRRAAAAAACQESSSAVCFIGFRVFRLSGDMQDMYTDSSGQVGSQGVGDVRA